MQPDGSSVCVVSSAETITKRMRGVVRRRGILRCVCLCVLTGVEFSVLCQLLSTDVELIRRIEASVSVEVHTGGEVHHQVGEGGDLIHDELVLV